MWPRSSLYRLSKAESKPSRVWAWALKYQSWCMINLTRSRLWDMYPLSLYFKNHKLIQATVPLARHHVSPELSCRAAYLSAGALSTNFSPWWSSIEAYKAWASYYYKSQGKIYNNGHNFLQKISRQNASGIWRMDTESLAMDCTLTHFPFWCQLEWSNHNLNESCNLLIVEGYMCIMMQIAAIFDGVLRALRDRREKLGQQIYFTTITITTGKASICSPP